jgi:hypothetical protein
MLAWKKSSCPLYLRGTPLLVFIALCSWFGQVLFGYIKYCLYTTLFSMKYVFSPIRYEWSTVRPKHFQPFTALGWWVGQGGPRKAIVQCGAIGWPMWVCPAGAKWTSLASPGHPQRLYLWGGLSCESWRPLRPAWPAVLASPIGNPI